MDALIMIPLKILYLVFILLAILILFNLLKVRSIEDGSIDGDVEEVSIIIPVRNDKVNAPRIIREIAGYGVELIVVDDESDDGTYEALKELSGRYRFKLIRVRKPDGWTGKTYACWRGALEARGRYILFLDSDTYISKEALRRISGMLMEYDVVSGLPRIRAINFTSSIFEYSFLILAWLFYPPWRHVEGRRWMAGSLMGWRRDKYFMVGGHRVVRGSLIEDVDLAYIAYRMGLRYRFIGGRGWYTIADYNSGGLIEFLKRVSIYVRPRWRSYIAVFTVGLLMNILVWLAPYTLLIYHTLFPGALIYIILLYTHPIYLFYKGYLRPRLYTLPLYPLSYLYTITLLYVARRLLDKEGIIRWRGRNIRLRDMT